MSLLSPYWFLVISKYIISYMFKVHAPAGLLISSSETYLMIKSSRFSGARAELRLVISTLFFERVQFYFHLIVPFMKLLFGVVHQ